jgi:hypothetical protein
MWDTEHIHLINKISFLNTLHLLRAVTLYIIMHVPPQPVLKFERLKNIVLLEILTPPYYERHLAHSVSHTKQSFNFLNTLHLLRAVTLCTSLCMYHQPVPGLSV